MTRGRCDFCQQDVSAVLGVVRWAGYEIRVCPNDVIPFALGLLPETEWERVFVRHPGVRAAYPGPSKTGMMVLPTPPGTAPGTGTCQACGAEGPVVEYDDAGERFRLCPEDFRSLALRSLPPDRWRALHALFPNAFVLHPDFYDSQGVALQPVTLH